jgi:hypothetical protein
MFDPRRSTTLFNVLVIAAATVSIGTTNHSLFTRACAHCASAEGQTAITAYNLAEQHICDPPRRLCSSRVMSFRIATSSSMARFGATIEKFAPASWRSRWSPTPRMFWVNGRCLQHPHRLAHYEKLVVRRAPKPNTR